MKVLILNDEEGGPGDGVLWVPFASERKFGTRSDVALCIDTRGRETVLLLFVQ